MRTRLVFSIAVFFCAALMVGAAPTLAQSSTDTGKLKIHVSPKQAYVFVDGKAIRDGSQTMELSAGTHQVGVYNYGYLPKTESIQIERGKKTEMDVTLQASGEKVSGPFADIEFKGDPRAAVLLNGTTPEYFVGHVDEFDWNWIWHQRLLVKPGTYQVTVTQKGNTIWSGPVTAKAGQQVTVHLDRNGTITTKDWKEGLTMGPQPRFHAGVASATVPIAPVTAQLSAQQTNIACGQATELKWNTADAASISISNLGNVAAQGDRSVNPTKNTTYELTAMGPGGRATQDVTVDVNRDPTVTLSLSQPEVRYHQVGDKVVEQDSATLNWSASNANSVMLEPIGNHSTTGSQTVMAKPKKMSIGPVNETMTYTLTAANACGGTTTRTASLHVSGSIDPPPAVTIASVFYPTAYPQRKHRKVGLVASEQKMLAKLASNFENFAQYEKGAKLTVVAHADVRGSKKYNEALTERRAELVKEYLVAHGMTADKIGTRAMGKEQQLDEKKVEMLLAKDPHKPGKWMTHNKKTTWLAYNRRVDIVLEPTGQESAEMYPDDAPDARILWARKEPSLKSVETAAKTTVSVAQAKANTGGK
ncbi:MAG TPA: OmpA family protein [Candidatus Angelobacter sp.]|nr:OmpA family protein [Candidatus Angelobacter sp.]